MRASLIPLLLVACSPEAPDTDDTDDTDGPSLQERVQAFQADGPHRVGYRERSVTYDDPTGGERTLRVGLWYPTDATGGPVRRFTGPNAPDDVQLEPAAATGPFPLVMFSHGHQGNLDNASWLMRKLATHGWVVAAPEHTGNTLADGDSRTTEIYVQRPYDVRAALDDVQADDADLGGLDGRVLAMGHSFGGYTTFLLAGAAWDVDHWSTVCTGDSLDSFCSTWSTELETLMRQGASDDRFDAAITLAGGNWGQLRESGLAAVDRPLLQVTGQLDSSVPNEGVSDPIWRDLPAGDKVRVDLAHGDHLTCTDFAKVFGGALAGSSPDALDAQRGYDILSAYVLGFAATHVLGETGLDALLDGTFAVDEDATVSTK